ncbi:STAS domain-containing protein [Nocardia heshunensis]
MSTISISPGSSDHYLGSSECVVVRVDGELDITGLDTFRRALAVALSRTPATIVVDLREARFLSLRNAVALAEAIDEAAVADIEMRLLTRHSQVRRVLEITGAGLRNERMVAARPS